MKIITAKKLIGKMLDNVQVNIKGHKCHGINEKTLFALYEVLSSYGYKKLYTRPLANGFIEVKADDFILSTKVKVY